MLTQKDFDEIEKIISEQVEEKTRNLPTKNEFFTKMDEVVKELETIRQEDTILGHQVSDHEKRIAALEESKKGGHFATVS